MFSQQMVLLSLTYLIWITYQVRCMRIYDVDDGLLWVQQQLTKVRGGELFDFAPGVLVSTPYERIVQVLKKCRQQGVSSETLLRVLLQQLNGQRRFVREMRRLNYLLAGRVLGGLILGGLSRWLILAHASWAFGSLNRVDLLALVFSSLVMLVTLMVYSCQLPRPWFWCQGLSVAGGDWLLACGDLQPPRLSRLAEQLACLRRQELLKGVSLTKEKQAYLQRWLDEQNTLDELRLKRLEEWLPLLELFGLGVPVFLMLMVPALRLLQISWL